VVSRSGDVVYHNSVVYADTIKVSEPCDTVRGVVTAVQIGVADVHEAIVSKGRVKSDTHEPGLASPPDVQLGEGRFQKLAIYYADASRAFSDEQTPIRSKCHVPWYFKPFDDRLNPK
jgi:hypothetical protein